jgi:hypothetical protein
MVIPGRELLAGAIEVDESYFGARRPGAAGRGVTGKPIVAIAVEDRGEASGRVRMRRIPDVTKATLTAFVLDHIAAVPRCALTAGRAISTSAATPSRTWSRTYRPQRPRQINLAVQPSVEVEGLRRGGGVGRAGSQRAGRGE